MSTAKAVMAKAEPEVGYLEKATNSQLYDKTANAGNKNFTKYWDWYKEYTGVNYQGEPWCACFVSWCGIKAGCDSKDFFVHIYCPTGVTWYKNKGRWHDKSGYTPKIGDVIYFQSNGVAAHVGLVRAVDKARVYTLEGNTDSGSTLVANGGGVAKKDYPLSSTYILGYGSPNYKEDDDMTDAQVLELAYKAIEKSDPLIKNLNDCPSGIKSEVKELIDKGYIKGTTGSTSYQIGKRQSALEAIVVAYRAVKDVKG